MAKNLAALLSQSISAKGSRSKGSGYDLKERMNARSNKAKTEPVPTSKGRGVWTSLIKYNPEKQEMVIKFSDGFIAVYPNISEKTFEGAHYGVRTKSYKPNRNNSVGAWLHKHPGVMRNYREGTSDDLMRAPVLLEDNTYGTSTVYEEDGTVLFDMGDHDGFGRATADSGEILFDMTDHD